MPSILINDLSLEFRLRRSERAKRLHIVFQEKAFEVVAPRRVSNHVILSFLWQQRHWMTRAYQRHQKTAKFAPVMFYLNNLLLFRGKQWPLSIQYGTAFDVAVLEESLVCTVPVNSKKPLQKWLVEWLHSQTQGIIESMIQAICPLLGRYPKKVSVKQQKTRWGSCGINDAIHINWLLIFAPPGVLEYVIVHELCHLIHRNHSKRFWNAVARCFPDYKAQRNWLRKQGDGLMKLQIEDEELTEIS